MVAVLFFCFVMQLKSCDDDVLASAFAFTCFAFTIAYNIIINTAE